MEFRRIFDTIPEQFDKYRPRYCPELFTYLIKFARIDTHSKVLELGSGHRNRRRSRYSTPAANITRLSLASICTRR